MTDYAELRAALDAGPTPGPWTTGDSDLPVSTLSIHGGNRKHSTIARLVSADYVGMSPSEGLANMRLIAAANPAVIRALLADYDALKSDIGGYVSHASELDAENLRLRAEKDALREALVAILEHDSPINIVDTATATEREIFELAQAALAQERGGDDG